MSLVHTLPHPRPLSAGEGRKTKAPSEGGGWGRLFIEVTLPVQNLTPDPSPQERGEKIEFE